MAGGQQVIETALWGLSLLITAAVALIPAPANNGTLTINYGGTTIAMFGADDAGNVTADIPEPGAGVLTVTVDGITAGTFSANQSTNATIALITMMHKQKHWRYK